MIMNRLHSTLLKRLIMNTDPHRFDPRWELQDAKRKYKHWCIAPVIFVIGVMLIFLWAHFTRGCQDTGLGSGSGGITNGGGSGSGNGGKGTGAGSKGSGAGAEKAAQKVGSGKNNTAPGSQAPNNNTTSSDAAGNTDKKQPLKPDQPMQLPNRIVYAPQGQSATTPVQSPDNKTGGSASGRKGFYGVKSKPGGKVIFLVDVSGSMASPSREIPGKNRLDVLKMQLKQEVFGGDAPNEATYKRNGGFIVMPFSDTTLRYPGKKLYRYRNKQDMAQAAQNINALQCYGGTFMCQAWEATLKVVKSEKISMVFFLTDGEPGDAFNAQWLQKKLAEYHIRDLHINCISIGSQRDFMQEIAKGNKGQYVYIP